MLISQCILSCQYDITGIPVILPLRLLRQCIVQYGEMDTYRQHYSDKRPVVQGRPNAVIHNAKSANIFRGLQQCVPHECRRPFRALTNFWVTHLRFTNIAFHVLKIV